MSHEDILLRCSTETQRDISHDNMFGEDDIEYEELSDTDSEEDDLSELKEKMNDLQKRQNL